jgi:hypothetical protein
MRCVTPPAARPACLGASWSGRQTPWISRLQTIMEAGDGSPHPPFSQRRRERDGVIGRQPLSLPGSQPTINGTKRTIRKVVGLDISLQKTAVCALDHDGQLAWQGKVDSELDPLIEKLRLWHDQIDVVGPEACQLSEWLYRHLVAAGFKAVCVQARHAQRFLSTRPVKPTGTTLAGSLR